MRIDKLHTWINFLADKSNGAYFTPEEIDNAVHEAQLWYFSNAVDAYALTQKLQDSLAPFKKPQPFLTGDTAAGVLTLEDDYAHLLGGRIVTMQGGKIRHKPLRIKSEDELAGCLDSQIRPVTAKNPIAVLTVDDILIKPILQFYPQAPLAGEVYYLRTPEPPKYAYTQPGRVPIYDDANSVQLRWTGRDAGKIAIKALEYLGVSVEAGDIVQYADAKSKEPN